MVHRSQAELLQFFEYGHLSPQLARVSRPFHELATRLVEELGETQHGAELTTALRKLLEAKDAAVRAAL